MTCYLQRSKSVTKLGYLNYVEILDGGPFVARSLNPDVAGDGDIQTEAAAKLQEALAFKFGEDA